MSQKYFREIFGRFFFYRNIFLRKCSKFRSRFGKGHYWFARAKWLLDLWWICAVKCVLRMKRLRKWSFAKLMSQLSFGTCIFSYYAFSVHKFNFKIKKKRSKLPHYIVEVIPRYPISKQGCIKFPTTCYGEDDIASPFPYFSHLILPHSHNISFPATHFDILPQQTW